MKDKPYLLPSIFLEIYYRVINFSFCKSYDILHHTKLSSRQKPWNWEIPTLLSYYVRLLFEMLFVLLKIFLIKVIMQFPNAISKKVFMILLSIMNRLISISSAKKN